MSIIFKKTIITLMIFWVVPLLAITVQWHWQPEYAGEITQHLLWITESAGSPWALITATVLFVLFCLLLKATTIRKCAALWLILFMAILAGQVIKSAIKYAIQEPRPYVALMEQTAHINHDAFYALPKAGRKSFIQNYAKQKTDIPLWLATQWQSETDYSLPSGHTLFATTWAFLALVLLGFKKHRIFVSLLIIWAVLIEISRLALGMHYPLDLICGALLAWLIAIVCYFAAKKWRLIE